MGFGRQSSSNLVQAKPPPVSVDTSSAAVATCICCNLSQRDRVSWAHRASFVDGQSLNACVIVIQHRFHSQIRECRASLEAHLLQRIDVSCRLFTGHDGGGHQCLAAAFVAPRGISIEELWSFFTIDPKLDNFVLVPPKPKDFVQQLTSLAQCVGILQSPELSCVRFKYGLGGFRWLGLFDHKLLSSNYVEAGIVASNLLSIKA